VWALDAPNSGHCSRNWASIRWRKGVPDRQGEAEGAALAPHRLNPDATAVALDDLLTDAQPQARSRILRARVDAAHLANLLDQPLRTLRFDADAVFLPPDQPHVLLPFGAYVNPDRSVTAELKGVVDEVLQDAQQLDLHAIDGG